MTGVSSHVRSSRLRAIGQETVAIVERGGYRDVVIRDAVARAVAGTRLHRPEEPLAPGRPNRAAMAGNQPEHLDAVPGVLARRARRVLAVAAAHGHRRLVLGTWGCGVFGNEPAAVADIFAGALADCPWFDRVTFAILDRAAGAPTLAAFSPLATK